MTAIVCTIGVGLTRLWTAYYLKKADPSLNIVIVKKLCGLWCVGSQWGVVV